MHWHKKIARLLAGRYRDSHDNLAVEMPQNRQIRCLQSVGTRRSWMHLNLRFGAVMAKLRGPSAAGHRVPLIAHAPGIEQQR
jgi:hypothetical protein